MSCLLYLCLLGVLLSCVLVLASLFQFWENGSYCQHYSDWLALNPVLLRARTWCFGSEIVQTMLTSVCGIDYYKYTHYQYICSACYLWSSCCYEWSWNFKAINPSALVKSYMKQFELPWYLRCCLVKGLYGIDCHILCLLRTLIRMFLPSYLTCKVSCALEKRFSCIMELGVFRKRYEVVCQMKMPKKFKVCNWYFKSHLSVCSQFKFHFYFSVGKWQEIVLEKQI